MKSSGQHSDQPDPQQPSAARKPRPQPEGDLSGYSMTELFRIDAENQLTTLAEGLLALSDRGDNAPVLEELMRAAHSIKGAARIVNMDAAVGVAHSMEDIFVKGQKAGNVLAQARVDLMLEGVDLLRGIIFDELPAEQQAVQTEAFAGRCAKADAPAKKVTPPVTETQIESAASEDHTQVPPNDEPEDATSAAVTAPVQVQSQVQGIHGQGGTQPVRSMRIASENLDRLVTLSGETRIALNRYQHFDRQADELVSLQQDLRDKLKNLSLTGIGGSTVQLEEQMAGLFLSLDQVEERARVLRSSIEEHSFRMSQLGDRLYTEALTCRMRPFSDCLLPLRRLVHDLSRSLGKSCSLEVDGESTEVDRDILEKLEGTLTHLIKNALDHGIETEADRVKQGKPAGAVIRLSAAHVAGRLVVRTADDGRGIKVEEIRDLAVKRGLITPIAAASLSAAEVMEFLFLPGFSMSSKVTEISGRGVGLDAVRSVARNLHGAVRAFSTPGKGTAFELSLPISKAIARCLLVSVGGTPCAFPLARIEGVFRVHEKDTFFTEGRQHCEWNGNQIGLINAAQVLELEETVSLPEDLPVVVLEDTGRRFGVVVHDLIGEEELLLQPLDEHLGKLRDVSAAALMADGSPVLVLDDEDFLRSISNLAGEGSLRASRSGPVNVRTEYKRVLVVDDSLTVRELQRKLLTVRGYEVTTAVDGMDGWNTLREHRFDMVITDVDMPRMDGIELVEKIRAASQFRDMPVMIVSYKDRPEDRQRGLEAGADYYLAKSSFHSDELSEKVEELIGPAVNVHEGVGA